MSGDNEVIADMQDGAADIDIANGEVDEGADGLGELAGDMASRPMRKAKRQLGRSSPGKEVGIVPDGVSNLPSKKVLPLSKNSRKSRDGRGRGLPKKGKTTWLYKKTNAKYFFLLRISFHNINFKLYNINLYICFALLLLN